MIIITPRANQSLGTDSTNQLHKKLICNYQAHLYWSSLISELSLRREICIGNQVVI